MIVSLLWGLSMCVVTIIRLKILNQILGVGLNLSPLVYQAWLIFNGVKNQKF